MEGSIRPSKDQQLVLVNDHDVTSPCWRRLVDGNDLLPLRLMDHWQ